jgi:hypothetical protein
MKLNSKNWSEPYIELSHVEVARRAVQLWKAAGCPTHRNLHYWLQSVVELVSEQQPRHSNLAGAVHGR